MMLDASNTADRKERVDKIKSEVLRDFFDAPLTRMAVTAMGEAGKGEVLRLLISAAFDSGFAAGQTEGAGDIAMMLYKTMRDKPLDGGEFP